MQMANRTVLLCLFLTLLFTLFEFLPETKQALALDKPTGGTMDLVEIVKEHKGMIVQIKVPLQDGKTSLGSGFWVNDRGYVATCWHVVVANPTGQIKVKSAVDPLFDLQNNNMVFASWEVYSASVVTKDEKNDLALLKVEGNPFSKRKFVPIKIGDKELTAHYKQATLNTKLPEAGQKILIAGYPLGRPYPVIQEGTIASIAHSLPEFGPYLKILLSTVANPGNSGGPVIDRTGKVIGLLEGGLPSRPEHDPAQAQSGIAVVVPAHYLSEMIKTVHGL